jgi:methionyl-tRNA synthetase
MMLDPCIHHMMYHCLGSETLPAHAFLQSIFKKLHANNMLVEQTMEQLYSEALGKFLADRFVTGTCPKCKYEVGSN